MASTDRHYWIRARLPSGSWHEVLSMKSSAPRWKLLLFLLALPFVLLAGFRLSPLEETGWGGAAAILAIVLALVLATIWLILFSRLSWSRRLLGLVLLSFLGVGLRFSVRKEGHMGNFFPHLAWKWSPKSDEVADSLDITSSTRDATISTSLPGDFPYFLGPNRDNWVSGSLLAPDWHEQTPRELWRRDIGLGWSSFSVAGPYAYTMEQRGDEELTVCYEARTGSPIWVHSENARFSESMGGDGPRSTPAIHQGHVYSLGAEGLLLCLDGLTGEMKWKRDTLAEAEQKNLTWAKSSSPIIVDDTVVITLGNSKDRSLAAFDCVTGEPRWREGEDRSSYATPVLATLAGKRQIVALNGGGVSSHDPANGTILWSHKIGNASAHAASPLIIGDSQVLVSVGYGRGAWLLDITPEGATEVWQSNKFKTKFADTVLRDDHVYGLDEGKLTCLRLSDGKRAWRGTRFKHGQMLGVGDKLLIQAEAGEIAIVAAEPDEERILHKFDALSGKTWNHPVLAGRLLLVRNDREAIVYEYP
ncbi:MAG: outer membrane protein assembly factor BamB, partial [Verrucomicrobiales bacterium]